MSVYLIDTDWIVDILHGNAHAMQTLLDLAPDGLAISLITYGELYEGAHYARDPQQALGGLRAFLRGQEVATPDDRDHGALRDHSGPAVAATALHHDLTLLTRNIRDFRLVPNLKRYGDEEGVSP